MRIASAAPVGLRRHKLCRGRIRCGAKPRLKYREHVDEQKIELRQLRRTGRSLRDKERFSSGERQRQTRLLGVQRSDGGGHGTGSRTRAEEPFVPERQACNQLRILPCRLRGGRQLVRIQRIPDTYDERPEMQRRGERCDVQRAVVAS